MSNVRKFTPQELNLIASSLDVRAAQLARSANSAPDDDLKQAFLIRMRQHEALAIEIRQSDMFGA